jgi:aldehyde:ferredoxin oxidoreductase
MLPKKAIEEFKKIYKKSYGVELSDEEATDKANRLVNLYRAVYSDDKWTLPKDLDSSQK